MTSEKSGFVGWLGKSIHNVFLQVIAGLLILGIIWYFGIFKDKPQRPAEAIKNDLKIFGTKLKTPVKTHTKNPTNYRVPPKEIIVPPKEIIVEVIKEQPKIIHPFGEGMGSISLYTPGSADTLWIYIDDVFKGMLFKYQGVFNKPPCGSPGTLPATLSVGYHKITTKVRGKSGEEYFMIYEDSCIVTAVKYKMY